MKLFRLTAAIVLSFALFPSHTLAEYSEDRPRIGLALSGGGARGGAHIGVLKVIEELGVPIDYIAGTSMGAIIGGLYAAGYSADEIEGILAETDWRRALSDQPARRDRTMRKKELEAQFLIPYRVGFNKGGIQLPLGLIEGQHLDQLFHRMLFPVVEIRDFDQLPIPFRAVATDLVTGEEVILSGGSLPDALRASMSVPGAFSPVRIDDRLLVDGGMSNNLPVSVARDMGADIVIAVDISSAMLTEEQLTSVLSVTEQLTNFLVRRTTDAQLASLGDQDLLIVPELGNFSAADFSEAIKIIPNGYEAASAQGEALEALASGARSTPRQQVVNDSSDYLVQFIDIVNGSKLHDEIIRSRLAVNPGEKLDLAALERSVDQIYSLDVFTSVTYDLVENEEGESGLRVNAVPRSWGPNYLQFGLELSSDFSGSSDFKLGAAYTHNALNALGGELRVVGSIGREDELSFDFYQPIDTRARWFVEPQFYFRRENYNYWEDDVNIAKLEIDGWGVKFGVGRNLNSRNRLRLDYEFARADADVITGDLGFPLDDEIEIGELVMEYLHDSLDSLWFPGSGTFHRWGYRYASESLGASGDYEQIDGNGSLVLSRARDNFLLNYELGYSFDDAAPIERWYRMGGFGRLSGLVPNQLSGRQAMLTTLAYYRRLNDVQFAPVYAGLTLEAGNVWNTRDEFGLDDLRYSGSLFLGAETPIGPIYLAVGHSDSGDTAAYFYVGNPFRVSRFD
jgi:NTE family protein